MAAENAAWVSWLDPVLLKTATQSLAGASQKDSRAACRDSDGRSTRGNIQPVYFTQDEESAKPVGQFVETGTHPFHEFIVGCDLVWCAGEHLQAVVWVHSPGASGVKEAVHGIIFFNRVCGLVGGCSPGFPVMVDDFELHDSDEPGAEGRAPIERIQTLPGNGEAILHQIFCRMMVFHPRQCVAVKRVRISHQFFNSGLFHM